MSRGRRYPWGTEFKPATKLWWLVNRPLSRDPSETHPWSQAARGPVWKLENRWRHSGTTYTTAIFSKASSLSVNDIINRESAGVSRNCSPAAWVGSRDRVRSHDLRYPRCCAALAARLMPWDQRNEQLPSRIRKLWSWRALRSPGSWKGLLDPTPEVPAAATAV